jgi:hypothetical protein
MATWSPNGNIGTRRAPPCNGTATIWRKNSNDREPGVYNRAVPTLEAPLTCPDVGVADSVTAPAADEPQAQAKLLLRECCAPDSAFAEMAAATAVRKDLDPRALSVRTLLHLPRVANPRGYVSRAQVDRELFFTGRQLRKDANAAHGLISAGHADLADLLFTEIPPEQAEAIFSRLHYLRSGRANSVNFALIDPGDLLPITLCSVSPLEWRRLGSQIKTRFGIPADRIWDISRVYSRNGSPANAISYLLSRVRIALRRSDHEADLFVTAVDQNLGFLGSSYRAANWQQWFTVQARPYLYHERRYVSPRQLRQEFGSSNLAELQARHPEQRFEQSRVKLMDSMIFCCRLNVPTETVEPFRLHR